METQHLIAIAFMLIACSCSQAQLVNFTNPIFDTPISHPSILKVNDFYYLTVTGNQNTEIHVLKSKYLTNFRYVEKKVIYKVNVGYSQIESPRMQEVNGDLYLYFAMRNESVSQRMHVMKAVDSKNPMGRWIAPIRLLENIHSLTSIHGTVMQHDDNLYFVWTSLHPVADTRQINIAPMISPTEVMEPIVTLKQPTEIWECQGYCSNEYPSFIYNNISAYMIFSASASNHPDHCLSYMRVETGRDPMNPLNWEAVAGPVFSKDDGESVYATGHSTFTTSPDGTEIWMLYQGSASNTTVVNNHLARVERIDLDGPLGVPIFPTPHGLSNPQPRPSGEPEMFTNPILDDRSPDPTVIRQGEFYYLVRVLAGLNLTISKSSLLTDFRDAETQVIYSAPEGFTGVRWPTVQELDGQLYIYFGMINAAQPHSPYVISALNPRDPMGSWSDAKRLLANIWTGTFTYGSVLTANDRLYFVWSHATTIGNDTFEGISIAQMENAGEVTPPVVLLRQAKEAWECIRACTNRAPRFMYNDGVAYMVFSVSSGADPGSGLSYMCIESDRDPLDVANWISATGQVFSRNNEEAVYAVINADFTTSPDGTETWMIYQAGDNVTVPGELWTPRIERIEWDAVYKTPIFPKPHGFNNPQPVPRS